MAKKTVKKVNKIFFDQNLPQNIVFVGEKVEEDKNIYISQAVYKEIHKFTKNKTKNESGGMLIGNVIEEFGKTNIVIHGFVEAKYAESTPTTLKFTHKTWDYVHGEIDGKYENGQMVGWIHTHPDFGIFLSEYDKFIQENFFKEAYQIAYVVDPIQNIEGFYFWINGKIERCKGFCIFGKTGEKIEIDEGRDSSVSKAKNEKKQNTSVLTLLFGCVLMITVVAFVVINMNMMNRIKILETQQENTVESANQSIRYLQQQISTLNIKIIDLDEQIRELKTKEKKVSEDGVDQTDAGEVVHNDSEASGLEDESTEIESEDKSSEEEKVNE